MEHPREVEKPHFLVNLFCKFLIGVLIFIGIFGIITVYQSVKSHDFWMNTPYYTDRAGGHCCGMNDCKYPEEWGARIVETETTFEVFTDHYGSLSFSKAKGKKDGLYFTEDEENKPVLCVYGGKIKCLAVPRQNRI